MKSRTLLLSLLFFSVIVAGCQSQTSSGPSITNAFIGGTSAMKVSFIENSPPSEVTDMQKDEKGTIIPTSGFPFDASVTIENVGENEIDKGGIALTMSGFYPGDFDTTTEELTKTYPESGVFRAVSKDPDGNKIQGDIAQVTFPKTSTKQFKYNKVLSGNQQFPFRVDVCYPYSTKVLSQVCLMKDFTGTKKTICSPTGSRPVSNSGAPVQVTSVSQSVGGQHKLLLNFEVKKVGTSDLFKYDTTNTCKDAFTNKDRISVKVDTGIAGLKCLGLLGGTEATDKKSYAGEVLLSSGGASFTCIQDYAGGTDSLKTFDVTLSYYARDTATTNVLVKHLI